MESKLEKIYATATVCLDEKEPCLPIEPSLGNMLATSRDYDKLLMAWIGWHDATGPKMKQPFHRAIQLMTKDAQASGYNDVSQVWMEDYEDGDFEKQLDSMFEDKIKPLYQQFHAYARRKLKAFYQTKFPDSSLIPAHLLGLLYSAYGMFFLLCQFFRDVIN